MEVMKENAQEDEAFLQEKIDRYGLQDLYCFLNRVAHHGRLWVQAQGRHSIPIRSIGTSRN